MSAMVEKIVMTQVERYKPTIMGMPLLRIRSKYEQSLKAGMKTNDMSGSKPEKHQEYGNAGQLRGLDTACSMRIPSLPGHILFRISDRL